MGSACSDGLEKELSDTISFVEEARRIEEDRLRHIISVYNHAKVDMESGNYREAAELLITAVEPIDAGGCYNWGVAFLQGIGTTIDIKMALYWLQEAAAKGSMSAYRTLSSLYKDGTVVEKDLEKAKGWAMRGAMKDDADSAYLLSEIYSKEEEASGKAAEAVKWVKRAAELGSNVASYVYGRYLYDGEYVPKNILEAKRYLSKYHKAYSGDMISLPDAAYYDAQYYIGRISYYGEDGLPISLYLAFSHIKKSAEGGNINAQFLLGKMLLNGEGCRSDKQEGMHWIKMAADAGQESAISYLNQEI